MPSVRVIPAASPAHMAQAAALFREYAASLPFSLCFQGFEQELATLPGRYAPPTGCLLLTGGDGMPSVSLPVGCVALREIEPAPTGRVCEMKRLYVQPQARGRGIARALCEVLLTRARELGYRRMKLDTSADMHPAHALYRGLGFVPCERYNDDPLPDTQYFELML